MAEATPATARRLEEIALHIASSFRALLDKFSAVGGVSADDRGVFVRGLYDGMMNEARNAGQPLPSRPCQGKRQGGENVPRPAPRASTFTPTRWRLASANKSASPHRWRKSPRNWKWLCASVWPRSTQIRLCRPQRHERKAPPSIARWRSIRPNRRERHRTVRSACWRSQVKCIRDKKQPLAAAGLCALRDEYTRILEAALRLPRSAS